MPYQDNLDFGYSPAPAQTMRRTDYSSRTWSYGSVRTSQSSQVADANVVGVGAIVERVRGVVGPMIGGLWISGEVSNLSMAASGHVYFTLKDRDASIRCAYFAGSARRHPATFRVGDKIEISGSLDVYAKSGDLQIKMSDWRHAGAGALYEAYLRLKAKLTAEGLFSTALKKPVPTFVRHVVIVTSPQAAALQDVRRTLTRRTPWIKTKLVSAYVQGELAPASLIAALEKADNLNGDVILLVRGGGSFEDLAAFNDEGLVRKLRTLRTPVIAGIGHESDETLAALAADVCASTPTAAAEHVGPELQHWLDRLDDCEILLSQYVERILDDSAQTIDILANRLEQVSGFADRLSAEVDRRSGLFQQLMSGMMRSREARFAQAAARLSAMGALPARRADELSALEARLQATLKGTIDGVARRLAFSAQCLQSPDAVLRAKTARMTTLAQALERAAAGLTVTPERRLLQADVAWGLASEQMLVKKQFMVERLETRLPDPTQQLKALDDRLRALGHALAGLDPDKPLKMGFARVERAGDTVTAAGDVAANDHLTLCFADGRVEVTAR